MTVALLLSQVMEMGKQSLNFYLQTNAPWAGLQNDLGRAPRAESRVLNRPFSEGWIYFEIDTKFCFSFNALQVLAPNLVSVRGWGMADCLSHVLCIGAKSGMAAKLFILEKNLHFFN